MFCFCLLCVSFLVGNVVIPEHISCFLPEREICFYRVIALSENLFTILDIIQKNLNRTAKLRNIYGNNQQFQNIFRVKAKFRQRLNKHFPHLLKFVFVSLS